MLKIWKINAQDYTRKLEKVIKLNPETFYMKAKNLVPLKSIWRHNGKIYEVAKSSGNFLTDPNNRVQVRMLLEAGSNSADNINIVNRPTKRDVLGLICS